MSEELVTREWKKVFESDLDYIVGELKDLLKFPALIILTGAMGSGKTTFAKKVVARLAPKSAQASSPTYSVINDYGNILHADFYRLKHPSELVHLELPMAAEGKDILLIEWGKEYFSLLRRELPDQLFCYELMIEFVDSQQPNARHYHLRQIAE